MSDYEVRPATMRDAKAVAEVHALAAKAAYEGILPEEELRVLAPASREAKWREAIEFSEPQVQVAEIGGEVVGFVGFDRSRDPKTPATTGEIWAIYVKPVGVLTPFYMAVIDPFRRLFVYPALIRQTEEAWRRAYPARTRTGVASASTSRPRAGASCTRCARVAPTGSPSGSPCSRRTSATRSTPRSSRCCGWAP